MSADDTLSVSVNAAASTANEKTTELKNNQDQVNSQKRKTSSTSFESETDQSPKRARLGQSNEAQSEPVPVADGAHKDNREAGAQPAGDNTRRDTKVVSQEASTMYDDDVKPRHLPEAQGPLGSGRKNFSHEDKKRGQRLFGGLLSTLSQTTASSHQKKRIEIERRQQERARKQRVEDDKLRADKQAKLNHTRNVAQVKFDEQVMQTRHSNLLAMARCLKTSSEPPLYYQPWELTKAQESIKFDQINSAKNVIDQETQQFELHKDTRLKDLGVTVGEPVSHVDANSDPVPAPRPFSKHSHDQNTDDDVEDVMVENEEDTVIY